MSYYPSRTMSAMSISTARLTAATLAGRAVGAASRLARRGTGASIRGKVMLKIDPGALAKLLAGKRIAVVSGTNGKTTTTHFLAAALRTSLDPHAGGLVHNADGANLHHGLASALSQHPDAGIAILESDERVVGDVIRLGRPEVLVLLNFSRDQLDRHHEIKGLGRSWRTALTDAGSNGPIVVANADEPLVVWAAMAAKQVIWVDTAATWTQDSSQCPECDASLIRTQPDPTSGLGGDWYCSGCGLAQPKGDYRVESGTIIDRTQQVWDPQLSVPGVFNVSNAACALAAAELMGVEPRAALSGMRTVTSPAGRFATARIGNTTAAGQKPCRLGRSSAVGANPDGDTRDRLCCSGWP
jgi:UDP-N-acetylmuramyl tripeptide synthase